MLAARIGIRQGEFSELTPRELSLQATVYLEQIKEEARTFEARAYALATAVRAMIFSRYQPSFETLFPGSRRDMTDEAMFQQVQTLNKIFGGTEVS